MSATTNAGPTSFLTHSRLKKAPSAEYRAWVNGEEAYVFNHLGFAGGTMSWLSLNLQGDVEIRIRPHRKIDEARVLPRRAGVIAIQEGNDILFKISKPGNYMVEWDALLELPFFVFARPPLEKKSSKPPGRRIEFGPGDHHPGCIHLFSGDELYLAAGAEVYGAIKAENASGIRITGCGILNQSHLPFGGKGEERHPLELINCQDVEIDGPTFLEGCTWNIVFRDCDRVTIRNTSILSERPYSTDGINPCDSRDVLVQNCFIRSKDDCVTVKGMQRKTPKAERKPIQRITVRDCLFWSDNNNGLVVGTETWASEISQILFERADFVKVSGTCGDWAAAFAVQALADSHIHDICFTDIDVETCTGNPFSILYLDQVYGIPGEKTPEGGLIENVVFRNIRFHAKPRRHSIIQGHDATRTIKNVRFENVAFGNRPIVCPDDLRLTPNAHVHGLKFL